MPKYMYQVACASESWATQVGSPQDREQQVGEAVQRLGAGSRPSTTPLEITI